ncbi:DUF624 domain-containing protein [Hominenteromicrobium sp.]|uniref:DUF624 domain-containing protein n=1 Tax=Hominenteromicrobium sp. TaxID=3073581 RepID=UPI003A8CC0CB
MIPFIVVIALMVGVFLLPVPHFLYATSFFGVLDLYILYAVTLPLILLSPFTCGLAYVTRNFAREEHAFVWSDFWDAVKNNWKPALLNGVIVYLAYVILSFSIFFYSTRVSDNWMFMIPLAVCCILSILMLFAQYYIPVMIVTFDLKLRHIYRNAFIFSIMGLLRNLMITAILAGLFIAFLFCPAAFVVIPLLLVFIFLCAFISYLTSFATYSLLDTYLIQPFYKKEAEAKDAEIRVAKDGDTFNFDNDELDDDDDDKPQYVYVNGRLIDRKIMEQESLFSDKTDTSDHLQ